MGENKYGLLWKKHLPLIEQYLKKTRDGEQTIQFSKSDFAAAGTRDKYTFNLHLGLGKVTNDIGGSAVARDLADALQNTPAIKAWLMERSVVIGLTGAFVLKMRQIVVPKIAPEVALEVISDNPQQ